MKILPTLIVAVALIPGAVFCSSALAEEVPDRIDGKERKGGPPLWVSLEEAAPAGQIRWELLPTAQQRQLRQTLSSAPPNEKGKTSCAVESATVGDYFSGNPSFGELIHNSKVIYSGRILGLKQGFYRGSPSTLLEVAVTHAYKAPDELLSADRIYVAYPYAKINLEGKLICQRPQRGYAEPAAGGRILVFSFRNPAATADLPIVEPMDEELFFETAAGESSVPDHYRLTDKSPAWDTIEQQLESSLKPRTK